MPVEQLRFTNEREQSATRFVDEKGVKISSSFVGSDDVLTLEGRVKSAKGKYQPSLRIDADERIIEAECTCNWHQQNRLRKGPCEHILALRMQHARLSAPERLFSLS